MPCSKGKTNENGELCPYCANEPQTMEGWEAWDIALRCAGQLRMAQFAVVGIDLNAALELAGALGYNIITIAEFLTASEAGMVSSMNEKFSTQLT